MCREAAVIAAVIPACNEEQTVGRVVRECRAAGLDPVLVVANGCTDATAAAARDAGAEILLYPEPLGHDVGRALGAAALPTADGILFLDADLPLPARDLIPFRQALERREVDIALNRLDALIGPAHLRHPVLTGNRFLNLALGRPDLGHSTLTAIPHGLSRQALEALGAESLAVPAVAHVRAVLAGLRVAAIHPVEVLRRNRRRAPEAAGDPDPVASLIQGDQLEAISILLAARGPRGGQTDLGRRRDLLQAGGRAVLRAGGPDHG